MMPRTYSRRSFIKAGIYSSGISLVAGQLIFNGCESKGTSSKEGQDKNSNDPCEDLSGLSETDIKTRTGLGYVKESPISNMQCKNCNLWLPPAKDKTCGGCLLFKGPVNTSGYCTNWAAKV
jgi:hypothetical protein